MEHTGLPKDGRKITMSPMKLLLNQRFAPYHHELECLIQTLHGPNAHVDSAAEEATHVQFMADDDEASVSALTDLAFKLEQMASPTPQTINDFIYGALEFPKDTPCIFPIETLQDAARGNDWLKRALVKFAKNDPINRRLAGCLCGLEIERQLQRANWGKAQATIGQRLKAVGIEKLEGYKAIDFVKPNPKIQNLARAMQLIRALRIRNNSVHLNQTEPSQSEIETLIITTLEIEEILKAT